MLDGNFSLAHMPFQSIPTSPNFFSKGCHGAAPERVVLATSSNDLKIVPVLNKIDLPNANPEAVKDQLFNLFEILPEDVIKASAKTGTTYL